MHCLQWSMVYDNSFWLMCLHILFHSPFFLVKYLNFDGYYHLLLFSLAVSVLAGFILLFYHMCHITMYFRRCSQTRSSQHKHIIGTELPLIFVLGTSCCRAIVRDGSLPSIFTKGSTIFRKSVDSFN